MPQAPRTRSPRAQRLLVMAVMALVFAVTMGLAYLTTAMSARIPPTMAMVGPTQELVVNGLHLVAPGEWRHDLERARAVGVGGLVLRDPHRPHRWLLVSGSVGDSLGDAAPGDAAAGDAAPGPREPLSRYLTLLLGPGYERLLPEPAIREGRTPQGLAFAEFVGRSQRREEAFEQLHLAASLTDGQRHWLIYLTDRIEPDEVFEAVVQRSLPLFQRMKHTARLSAQEP